jgi:hypothetical protein
VVNVSLVETLKDRWNGEVESLVRRVQETDWNQVRARWESRIGTVWAKMRQSEAGDKPDREDAVAVGEEVKKVAETPRPEQSPQPKRLLEIG